MEVESEQRAGEVVAWRQEQENQLKLVETEAAIKEKLEEHLKVYKAQLQEKRRLGIKWVDKYIAKIVGPIKYVIHMGILNVHK